MEFSRPQSPSITLADVDGLVVGIKKLADGSAVTRKMPDGKNVTRTPILCSVLVLEDGGARPETTLVFPASLQRPIEQAAGSYVIGRISKGSHPTNDAWTLWDLEDLDDAEYDEAAQAFAELQIA
jgi:hypothetical protein